MRLPSWLRVRRTQQTGRTVTVDLTLDTSAFEEATARASTTAYNVLESIGEMSYDDRLQTERDLAQWHLDDLLDDWCLELGIDRETVKRERREQLRAERRARLLERQDPKRPDFIGRRP